MGLSDIATRKAREQEHPGIDPDTKWDAGRTESQRVELTPRGGLFSCSSANLGVGPQRANTQSFIETDGVRNFGRYARIRVRDKQHSNSLSSFGVSPRPTRSFPNPLSANLSMLIHVLAGACSGFRSDATLSALGPAAEDPRSRSRADEPERTLYQPHRSSCVMWKNKSVRHGSKRTR